MNVTKENIKVIDRILGISNKKKVCIENHVTYSLPWHIQNEEEVAGAVVCVTHRCASIS